MDTQKYKGQVLGIFNGEPKNVRVGSNGELYAISNSSEVEIFANQSRTTSGNSTEVGVKSYKEAIAFLDVTAASGTSPTLDVKFQTQDPVSLKWFDLTDLTFSQKVAAGSEMKAKINTLGAKLRCVYTIGGTSPSFDFSVGLILKS